MKHKSTHERFHLHTNQYGWLIPSNTIHIISKINKIYWPLIFSLIKKTIWYNEHSKSFKSWCKPFPKRKTQYSRAQIWIKFKLFLKFWEYWSLRLVLCFNHMRISQYIMQLTAMVFHRYRDFENPTNTCTRQMDLRVWFTRIFFLLVINYYIHNLIVLVWEPHHSYILYNQKHIPINTCTICAHIEILCWSIPWVSHISMDNIWLGISIGLMFTEKSIRI